MPISFYKLGNYLNDVHDGKFRNKSLPSPNGGCLIFVLVLLKLIILGQKTRTAIKNAQPWYDIVLTIFSGTNLSALLSIWLFILFGISVADFKEEGFRSSEHSYKNTFSTYDVIKDGYKGINYWHDCETLGFW